jgi:hypothetical protein
VVLHQGVGPHELQKGARGGGGGGGVHVDVWDGLSGEGAMVVVVCVCVCGWVGGTDGTGTARPTKGWPGPAARGGCG